MTDPLIVTVTQEVVGVSTSVDTIKVDMGVGGPQGIQGPAGDLDSTIFDAKGDLIGASAADTAARVPAGTDGQTLIRDDTATSGVSWLSPVVLNVRDPRFGAVGDGVADDTAAIQAAVNAAIALGAAAVEIPTPSVAYLMGQVTINNATSLVIFSQSLAQITLTGANAGFLQTGTNTDVRVLGIHFVGDGTAGSGQSALSNASGQTLADMYFQYNRVEDVPIGVQYNADTSGSIRNIEVSFNTFINMVGTSSGQGYGVALSDHGTTPIGGAVHHNTIRGAQRHSVYQSRGFGVDIHDNRIIDHRFGVASGSTLAAIAITRGGEIGCYDNTFIDCEEVCIMVYNGGATFGTAAINGNKFYGMRSGFAIVIGADPTTDGGSPDYVTIRNNFGNLGVNNLVRINCCKTLEVQNNTVQMEAGASTAIAINGLALGETSGTSTYSKFWTFAHNTAIINTTGSHRPLYLGPTLCDSGVTLIYASNFAPNSANLFFSGAVIQATVTVFVEDQSVGGLSFAGGHSASARQLAGPATTTAPGAGGAGALPATPAGYLTVNVNGTNRQVPYY